MPRGEKYAIENGMTIFDCRQIPTAFIEDTGEAYYDEILQTKGIINLPMNMMFISFDDDLNIMAENVGKTCSSNYVDCPENSIDLILADDFKPNKNKDPFEIEQAYIDATVAVFTNWYDFNDDCTGFVKTEYFIEEFENDKSKQLSIRLLGVLSLLKDKLVAVNIKPDPHIKETMRRARRGLKPISSASHVLTVNVAAVSNAIKVVKNGTHDSPCLHWRRGHWRVNFRGSEFERSKWINKCLVGDPDKGFVKKNYKLVNYHPMVEQSGIAL